MSRVAVVTGSASGIGRGVAEELARKDHRVALFDRQGDLVRSTAAGIVAAGGEALAFEVDVTDRDDVGQALDAVRSAWGPVAVMVTSAGVVSFDDVTDISPELWDRIIGINLTGTFNCLQAVVPDMKEAGWGRMVTISSTSAQLGAPRMAHYVASKGGVMALTRALAKELGGSGITVNTIPPSIVDTPMAAEGEKNGNAPGLAVMASITTVGRTGTVEDVASMTAYLVSDAAGFVTGQTIGVNGGWHM